MKKTKKLVAVFLALVLATVSLSACQTTGETASGTDSASTSDSESQQEEETSSDGNRPTLTLFVDETWWAYDTWEGDIPEAFSDMVNVDIEASRAVDSNQLQLMVASGDMPDLVCTANKQRMADSNVSYPLDELHEQFPDIDFPVHSVFQFVNRAADGHYYTIGVDFSPNSYYEEYPGILSEGPGFIIRKDMMEEMGNPPIESFEDLENLFARVKEEYPGVTPAVFNSVHTFNWVKMMMGIPMSAFYDTGDGSLAFQLRYPDQLEFYKTINRWYREGYLLPENFAFKTEDESKEPLFSGKAFSSFGYTNNADNYNPTILANGDDFQFIQFSGIISDKAKMYNTNAAGRGLYITRSCTDLEAAYRFLAAAYSDDGQKMLNWGIEGTDYTLDDQGYPEFNYDKESDADLKPRGLKYWGWMVSGAYVNGVTNYHTGGEMLPTLESMATIAERNPVIGMVSFEADSEESVSLSKINEMITTEQIKVYMAESEEACEQAFQNMLSTAESIGMEKLEDYANSVYPELKAEYDQIADNKE